MENANEQILDKLTKVCLCKVVSKAEIKKAILNGADTKEKVWAATDTGNGSCNGRRCGAKIEKLLAEMLDK